jgi:DHA3 family macrolide efflux protein-like MFS transporter
VRWPTFESAASLIVPHNHLTHVNAIDYIARGISNIIGPILAAICLRTIPMQSILTVDLIAAIGGMIPLMFISIPSVKSNAKLNLNFREVLNRSKEELKIGFKYVKRTPGLFTLLKYVSVTNLLLMPAESLLPLLVFKYFRGTETNMSIIGIAFGTGIVIGGILMIVWKGFSSRIKTSITGDLVFGFGVFLVGIANPDQFALAVFGWGLAGIGESLSLANFNALLQAHTRPEMQGRVFSILTSLINISVPAAMIASGPIAETMGVHFWYIFSGIGILIISSSMMFIPAMFQLERSMPVRRLDPSYDQPAA